MNANFLYANELLDFYGELLTQNQQEILSDYYRYDLSMQEIADKNDISKAAVSIQLNRSMKQLEKYEFILHMVKDAQKRENIIQDMQKSTCSEVLYYAQILEKIEEEEND